jgi:APA family basic amino acid/polyamine antiporter
MTTTVTTHTMLRRTIGPARATAMVVGTIVGASIFVQPSAVTGAVPSVVGIIAVWLAAGLLTLGGSLIAAELAAAFPSTGGVYVYLTRAFSPAIGFLWGWAMFWTMHTGIIAAIAMVFARYLGVLVPMSDTGLRLVAAGAVIVLSAVNYIGVRHGSGLQTALTVAKVVAIAGAVVAAFALGPRAEVPPQVAGSISSRGFLLAIAAGLFAFGGWHMVTYAAGETVAPERTIPRALVVGTILVTACYVLLNAAYLHVLPLARVATSTRIAADAADAVLGRGGAVLMAVLVVVSTFGALSGIVLAGPRAYLAMAQDGIVFRQFGMIHPHYQTPHRAIVIQGIWACILVITGSYRVLVARIVYTEWIFFAIMALGLLSLRRRPGFAPVFRAPFGSALPIAFAAAALLVAANQIVSAPVESLTGLAFVLAGWPVFLLWARRSPAATSLVANGD